MAVREISGEGCRWVTVACLPMELHAAQSSLSSLGTMQHEGIPNSPCYVF